MADKKKSAEVAAKAEPPSADDKAAETEVTNGKSPQDHTVPASDDRVSPGSDDDVTPDTPDGQTEPPTDSIENDRFNHVETEPEMAAAQLPPEAIVEKRGGFGAALIGGIVAAILGFLAARADLLDPVLPPAWRSQDNSAVLSQIENRLSAQSAAVTVLSDQLSGLAIPDLAPLTARLDDLTRRIDTLKDEGAQLNSALQAFDSQLVEVEKRPLTEGVSEAAITAYERELDGLRNVVAQQRTEVEELIAEARALDSNAAAAARQAAIQTALARLQTALDDGAPFGGIAEDLGALGLSVPEALMAASGDGIATLAALQSAFPEAARQALGDARASGSNGAEGLGAFLQRQLGARSVEPRAGDDPDAILSRAEAAVTNGNLDTAIDELSALPDTAQPALADWLALARERLAALDAAAALAQTASPK